MLTNGEVQQKSHHSPTTHGLSMSFTRKMQQQLKVPCIHGAISSSVALTNGPTLALIYFYQFNFFRPHL